MWEALIFPYAGVEQTLVFVSSVSVLERPETSKIPKGHLRVTMNNVRKAIYGWLRTLAQSVSEGQSQASCCACASGEEGQAGRVKGGIQRRKLDISFSGLSLVL